MIYHITTETDWSKFSDAGGYSSPTLNTEGFIHCCLSGQLEKVIAKFFPSRDGLLIISIDENRLKPELKMEYSADLDEVFPHICGRIDADSVVSVEYL